MNAFNVYNAFANDVESKVQALLKETAKLGI